MKNKIEFNAGIYPKVMSLTLGKPIKPNHDNIANNMEPELTIDLPRGVYLLYIQNMLQRCTKGT